MHYMQEIDIFHNKTTCARWGNIGDTYIGYAV